MGRDLLSRLMVGARVSTAVGVFSVLLGGAIGITSACLAGYFGGGIDRFLTRLMDIQLVLPASLSRHCHHRDAGAKSDQYDHRVRISQLGAVCPRQPWGNAALRNQEFMLARALIGAGTGRMIWRHLLPSVLPPLAVIATVNMSAMILNEASLSFLGFGVQPPTPAWGSMVSEARSIMSIAWWNAVFPGLAIALFVIGGNLMGDGLSQRKT